MNEFKAAVYQTAITQLKQKEALLAEERKNIIESILEEEKNSAGDKYETSRETMTQDLNSLEKQIKIRLQLSKKAHWCSWERIGFYLQ
jgi:hypothetical protein